MRRLLVLVGLVASFFGSACGGAAAGTRPQIVFGVGGGNEVPFQVTIAPGGKVTTTGSMHARRKQLSRATLQMLQKQTRLGPLSSRNCLGTLPDVGSEYIRSRGRTITVHGSCEPRFQRLWNELAHAVGLHLG